MILDQEQKEQLASKYSEIIVSLEDSILDTWLVLERITEPKTREHLMNGVIRRCFITVHCLRRIYKISPPTRVKHLSLEESKDVTVFLQTFLFHISGIMDNLSWAWFYEKKVFKKENPKRFKYNVSLFNSKFQKYLTNSVNAELQKYSDWKDHIAEFRDPIAHRIPPYVIPYILTKSGKAQRNSLEKQFETETDLDKRKVLLDTMNTLGVYEATYTHSVSEESPLVSMHPQLLEDTNKIIEIKVLIESNL